MKILRMLTAIVSPLLLLPGTSRAAAVIIWPVDPKIAAAGATALWIENKGNEPITMQIRTLRWSQGPQGDLSTIRTRSLPARRSQSSRRGNGR